MSLPSDCPTDKDVVRDKVTLQLYYPFFPRSPTTTIVLLPVCGLKHKNSTLSCSTNRWWQGLSCGSWWSVLGR